MTTYERSPDSARTVAIGCVGPVNLSILRVAAFATCLGTVTAASADSYARVIEAPVVSSEPIIEVRRERIPVEHCRPERVRVDERRRNRSYTPAVLGGVVGAAAGSVLGDNSSRRDLITGAGALLGASIGNDIGQRRRRDDGYYVTEEVCSTSYEIEEREQLSGFACATALRIGFMRRARPWIRVPRSPCG